MMAWFWEHLTQASIIALALCSMADGRRIRALERRLDPPADALKLQETT